MIEKKIALVTGASRGIGLEIARELIKEGISVIGTSRDKQTIGEIAAEETTVATKAQIQASRYQVF